MLTIFGGIGLFLLGMTMLTTGLKEIAGDALRSWLNTFTKGRFSAITTGAVMTILVQSSTATTLLTIGFVSAGLLTFIQSIGVIIGANIGSTSTGWIISLIGFKISLQAMSLPIIGVGVFMSLLAPGALKKFGSILAGFGLLFLGIDMLQQGMGNAQDLISFESIQSTTISGVIILILIGIIMTVIMQASSAAMAATLTALFAGAIDFEQAAYLVIGQNIGTTATALFASIGASIAAKRTAMTHFLFNVITAIFVTIFFKYFLQFSVWFTTLIVDGVDQPLALAIFHTVFSVVGMLIFLPILGPFSRLLIRIIPEKENKLTKGLEPGIVEIPSLAIDVSFKTAHKMLRQLMMALIDIMKEKKLTVNFEKQISEVEEAIPVLLDFCDKIQTTNSKERKKLICLLHAIDHLSRLIKVLREPNRIESMKLQEHLTEQWLNTLISVEEKMKDESKIRDISIEFEQTSQYTASARRQKRNEYFERMAVNETETELGVAKVDALLWVDRLVFHFWRASARMAQFHNIED